MAETHDVADIYMKNYLSPSYILPFLGEYQYNTPSTVFDTSCDLKLFFFLFAVMLQRV